MENSMEKRAIDIDELRRKPFMDVKTDEMITYIV